MKKFAFLSLFLITSYLSTYAQDWISIVGKSPYPQGVMVQFTGYDGFEELDLGSIRTTQGGEIDYFTDYHGRCMISAVGMPSYFLILEHDPVCLEWGSAQPFTCDPENVYFHENRNKLERIDSLFGVYVSAADSSLKVTSYLEVLDEVRNLYDEVSSSTAVHAMVYLQAELLMMRAGLTRDADQLAAWKGDIMDFAERNYEILSRSDYLGELAMAYIGMNENVIKTEISLKQAKEFDIQTWLERLGTTSGEKEMLDFLMIRFLEKGDIQISAVLASKYNDFTRCEQYVSSKLRNTAMPYTFNVFGGEDFSRVYNLDQFYGMPKILAMVSTDCPASVASVAGLYEYLNEKQIRIPVILVHEVEPGGKLAGILLNKAPFGLQTGMQTGSTLMFGAGVEQLPAFMMLDRNNLQQEIIYDLEDLKQLIGGDD